MEKVEILAPAGNYESFMAALNSGADAIYLGLDNFNARGNIENFNLDNLANLTKKAHLFCVKVYLTLNTLVFDNEIEQILNIVRKCLEIKVDAFIVQDIGLSYLLLNKFKGIELHASTQMGVHNLEGAKLLEELGFKRVVLARETSLDEIKRIKQGCNLEIEYFVQGALCVGFSGNCYLCSLLAGASGNRGKCKQFCRLKYDLEGKEGYFLSTKDFCMLDSLKDLVDCGVTSLKIEGRARRPAYVAVATQIYKKAVDANFKFSKEDLINLKKVYNRGDFISGYFKNEKIIYPKAQNHIGVPIGRVINFKKGKRFNEITILSTHNLIKGDAIKIFENEKEIAVLSIVDIKNLSQDKYLITSTNEVKVGQSVNLIVDYHLENNALNKTRKIDFDCKVVFKVGQRAKFILNANETTTVCEGEILEVAKNSPISEEEIVENLNKCGDEFSLQNVDFDIDKVFIRKAELNNLRRNAISLLREKLIAKNECKNDIKETDFSLIKQKSIKNNKKIVFFDDFNQIIDIINKNDYFVYSPSIYQKEDIVNVAKLFEGKNLYLDFPIIAKQEDLIYLKDILNSCENLGVYATNYYCLNLTSKDKIIIGSELNISNSYSLKFYHDMGFSKFVLSKEDFYSDDLVLYDEVFVDTRCPRYIYFNHCPFKEHFDSQCNKCNYRDGVKYKLGKNEFVLQRKKVISCHFYLKGQNPLNKNSKFAPVIEIKSHT